jgi:Fe2+ transport system protein B
MDIPPLPKASEALPRIVKHITEMTEEEREKVLGNCEKARASYVECIRTDGYNCERDKCKEMRCCKEREEKEKAEQLDTLAKRNKILEEHARQQEAKQKKMEKDLDKLANLVAQLMSK